MPQRKFNALKPGDPVRIVASSSAFEKAAFLKGVDCLKGFGLKPVYQKNIFEKQPYLAGTDMRRFTELRTALEDDAARAIFFARGGYGAMRLLPLLQKIKKPRVPKIILGFSDVTTLLLYFQKNWRWPCFYGPVIARDLFQDRATTQNFRRAVFDPSPLGELKGRDLIVVRGGVATAPVVGGCLTLVAASLGTDIQINTDKKILFLEDTNERPYQVDRLLMQLKLAGIFEKCVGVVFGSLSGPNPLSHYKQAIRDVLADYGFPVVMNFPAGHCKSKFTLPLGVMAELNTARLSLTYLESVLK